MKRLKKIQAAAAAAGPQNPMPALRHWHVTAADCKEPGDYCPWFGVEHKDRTSQTTGLVDGREFHWVEEGTGGWWVLTDKKVSLCLAFSKYAVEHNLKSGQYNYGYDVAIDDKGILFKFTSVHNKNDAPGPEHAISRRFVSELRIIKRDGEDANESRWGEWGYGYGNY